MGSLGDLPASLKIIMGEINRNVDKTVKDTAVTVTQTVVGGTPVDTGQARSNWIASLGDENNDVIEPHAPGRHLGIAETANAEETIRQAADVIAQRQPGQEIAICNNVDYIGLLNEGSSQQAPAAFVELAVQAGIEKVRSAKVVP